MPAGPTGDGDAKVMVRAVSKRFVSGQRVVHALDAVSLAIPRGRFVSIVGPSGCGKTTLLRMLAGLETPDSGTIEIAAERPEQPLISMVFQEQSVFPWMTVRANVEYGLRMRGVAAAERHAIAARFIDLVGLGDFAGSYPHQLSGGMKQRVSVARAFANDPQVLLMDEPFAALDEQNKAILQEELLGIWERTGKTVVFITHSIDEALVLADEVVVMTARPGRIKAVIPVPFARPRAVYALKADPEYGRAVAAIWALLREEVEAARREEVRRDDRAR